MTPAARIDFAETTNEEALAVLSAYALEELTEEQLARVEERLQLVREAPSLIPILCALRRSAAA